MPGIFGAVCHDPEDILLTPHEGMGDRLKHFSWYVDQRHVDIPGGVALGRVSPGFVNTDSQPALTEDRMLLAVMDGEIYDYEDMRRPLEASGHVFRGESHAELLLHGYEAEGWGFFRRLNGMFTAAIWDTRDRRLILVNDRFGMKPLYYAQVAGKFVFGSEIKVLLAFPEVSRELNPRGLSQFFTFGQCLGDDTFFQAVRCLPGAAWLTYDARSDRLSPDRYWRAEATVSTETIGRGDSLDRIDAAFQRAVERRVRGTSGLGISLSGGLDARTILALIDHDRVPITSVTIGIEGSLDHRCAAEMAALSGCSHHRYQLGRDFLADFEEHLRHMVHLTDGHYLCQCIVMPSLRLYRELGIEVLLRGHGGELMHMDKSYNYSLDRKGLGVRTEADLEDWLFGHLRAYMAETDTTSLFASIDGRHVEEHARESLRSGLLETRGMEPLVHRIWALFLSQRLRRETAMSMVEFGSVVETRLPYLDNDLVDGLLAAPPGLKLGDTIQSHILRRHRPAFLDVVNANTGARLGARRTMRALARMRLKVMGKLGVPGYQPYERLGLWLRQDLAPLVKSYLLSRRCLDRGVFDPRTIRNVVNDHLEGRCNNTFLILALLIFEAGLREFLDGESGYLPPTVERTPSFRDVSAASRAG